MEFPTTPLKRDGINTLMSIVGTIKNMQKTEGKEERKNASETKQTFTFFNLPVGIQMSKEIIIWRGAIKRGF